MVLSIKTKFNSDWRKHAETAPKAKQSNQWHKHSQLHTTAHKHTHSLIHMQNKIAGESRTLLSSRNLCIFSELKLDHSFNSEEPECSEAQRQRSQCNIESIFISSFTSCLTIRNYGCRPACWFDACLHMILKCNGTLLLCFYLTRATTLSSNTTKNL